MALLDIFSKRKQAPSAPEPATVYQDQVLPEAFRYQVLHVWRSAIGHGRRYSDVPRQLARFRALQRTVWDDFQETLAREYGKPQLGQDAEDRGFEQCQQLLLHGTTREALDIIELTMRFMEERGAKAPDGLAWHTASQPAADAIREINARFHEHAIGYQYQAGRLLRVESEYVHAEMVEPALHLLSEMGFAGPEQEFLTAHEHYRHHRYKEAIVEAGKAFESTMKAACDAKGWTYPAKPQAKHLIETLFSNGLLPDYLLSHFTALRSVLESGAPAVRNKSGHGQGAQVLPVPDYLAAYMLHMTAANILMIVRALKALP